MKHFSLVSLIAAFLFSLSAGASLKTARWTGTSDADGNLSHVISVADSKTGLNLSAGDFVVIEDRDMTTEHFSMYAQQVNGLPIQGMSIRIWTDLSTHKLIQAEAFLDSPKLYQQFLQQSRFSIQGLDAGLSQETALDMAKTAVKQSEDPRIRGIKVSEAWYNGQPSRLYEIKGLHGRHFIVISLSQQKIIHQDYQEFPQADRDVEFSVPVQIFPIYEQVESNHHILNRVPAELKYLKGLAHHTDQNPYGALGSTHYYESMMDPVLGETAAGRAKGYWSMNFVKQQAVNILNSIPAAPNSFGAGGVILEGRYATVSLHPDVVTKFPGINFTPQMSAQFKPDWEEVTVNGTQMGEMVPRGALLGKPVLSLEDAWNRPARHLDSNDPVSYINDGFDELQVYYAVNTLMESLNGMGFNDPELSTRPFNAFLYDPDITMQDNAFYTDDTINFTTYSAGNPNMARDNSTIWHELGHGVMDRLMGPSIQLADTGGLSEGMADFVAALVIARVTNGQSFDGSNEFRIINNTGFYLTNEVHDDGEAYGGSMKDLLDAAVAKFGQEGVVKVTDLTLETMRFTRNHPALTAPDWFSHMIFADSLGHGSVRAPSELHDLILQALNGRNFDLNGAATATYSLKNGSSEITSSGPGSRNNPIKLSLKPDDVATYHMSAALKDGDKFKFHFPVEVRVEYNTGALQGAIKWVGKSDKPTIYKINSAQDAANFDVAASGQCAKVNRPDGSCVDYAYIQIWNPGASKPAAKKRFYLRIMTKK